MTRRLLVASAAVFALLVVTGNAGAATLGITAPPTGSVGGDCQPTGVYGMVSNDPSTVFIVPAGGGEITQWETSTTEDVAGSSITMLVLAPSGTNYSVVGYDTETIPSPLPASGEAEYTLSTPIQAAAGDALGLYSPAANICFFQGGAVPGDDEVFGALGSPAVGEALTPEVEVDGYELNIGATLVTSEDAGVQSATPTSSASVGSSAVLTSTVINNGPELSPITFVDQVPIGLAIQSAVAGSGTCVISQQTVTCTISRLAVGQSANIDVIVTPSKIGSYANGVSVSVSGVTDPNGANNAASSTLVVAALPQQCIVPALRKLSLASARGLLKQLGCTVRVLKQHSSVAKGLVVSVRGGVASYPYHQLITLIVSEGPKKRKRH
jgi:Domain of unknown function DUF11